MKNNLLYAALAGFLIISSPCVSNAAFLMRISNGANGVHSKVVPSTPPDSSEESRNFWSNVYRLHSNKVNVMYFASFFKERTRDEIMTFIADEIEANGVDKLLKMAPFLLPVSAYSDVENGKQPWLVNGKEIRAAACYTYMDESQLPSFLKLPPQLSDDDDDDPLPVFPPPPRLSDSSGGAYFQTIGASYSFFTVDDTAWEVNGDASISPPRLSDDDDDDPLPVFPPPPRLSGDFSASVGPYSWKPQSSKGNSLVTFWSGMEAISIFDIGKPPVAIEIYKLGDWRGDQDIVGDCDLEGRGKYIVVKVFAHYFSF